MIRTELPRGDLKRRNILNHRRKQFEQPQFKEADYQHRLSFYILPPTADITLEQFEEWGINRLKILSELESCTFRNRTPEETQAYILPLLEKHLPLHSNSSRSSTLQEERKRDHYSHFILRLAFSATEDLRRRFSRLETQLFRLRWQADDGRERREFVESLGLDWEKVGEAEKAELEGDLKAASGFAGRRAGEEEGWFKVDWEKVPELVERRQCLVRRGKAYVPVREQMSLVLAEFTRRLDDALELTARALPRLDEDDRLTPILNHLSQSFTAPDTQYSSNDSLSSLGEVNASSIDALSAHFPLCMRTLHSTLRANSHLKHFGRLQYTLFLKGLGLNLEDCILFWRKSFKLMTDEKFTKEYKYNIRHAYGDVGGDVNRRGRGYTPYSCQKLLTEPLPGPGQCHGCPYRSYNTDNLISLLQSFGVKDAELLKQVKQDKEAQRYHIACNRVFESTHKSALKKVKDEGKWSAQDLDTILHPNTYFKRSFLLSRDEAPVRDVKMEDV